MLSKGLCTTGWALSTTARYSMYIGLRSRQEVWSCDVFPDKMFYGHIDTTSHRYSAYGRQVPTGRKTYGCSLHNRRFKQRCEFTTTDLLNRRFRKKNIKDTCTCNYRYIYIYNNRNWNQQTHIHKHRFTNTNIVCHCINLLRPGHRADA